MRALRWIGPISLLSAGLYGCVLTPPAKFEGGPASSRAGDQTQYLLKAISASPATLEAMYRTAQKDSNGVGRLHRALILSMPDYSGYDASTAAEQLRKLQSSHDESVATVARLRLAEMHEEAACQQKLHEIVVIERRMSAAPQH